MEAYRIHLRVISLHLPPSSSLFTVAEHYGKEGLMGVYFKVTRGNNRMLGKNRYAVYPSAANGITPIDEMFEQRSVFFKSHQNDRHFQEKKISIKLKQEVGRPGQKDKVIGKQTFDVARFTGKDRVIYEMNLESADPQI
jgi:hypothetical protein